MISNINILESGSYIKAESLIFISKKLGFYCHMRQSSRLFSQYLLVLYWDFLIKQIEFLQVNKDKIAKRDIKVDIT